MNKIALIFCLLLSSCFSSSENTSESRRKIIYKESSFAGEYIVFVDEEEAVRCYFMKSNYGGGLWCKEIK